MKFNCGLTPDEKHEAVEKRAKVIAAAAYEWHDHFAWWPVRIGSGDCRWLETVERRFPRMLASMTGAPVYGYTWLGVVSGPGWRGAEYRPKRQQRGDE